jgi:diacylglycerol kinase family enzyme
MEEAFRERHGKTSGDRRGRNFLALRDYKIGQVFIMYHIIVNPSSHSGNGGAEVCRALTEELCRTGKKYCVHETHRPGDAREIARRVTSYTAGGSGAEQIDRYSVPSDPDVCSVPGNSEMKKLGAEKSEEEAEDTVLVVIGGDGTVNETVNGVQDFSSLKFAFIPTGSGNDLARGLGFSDRISDEELQRMIRHIADGKILRHLDIGNTHINHRTDILSRQHPDEVPDDQRFLISSGMGFDAGVCEEALHSATKDFFNRMHLGKITYGAIAYRTLRSVYAHKVQFDGVTTDGKKVHMDHLLFASSFNLPYEGGGYRFAPDASGDDGSLMLVAIGDMPALQILWHFPGAHRGSHGYYDLPHVVHFSFRSMRIRTSEPLWLHTDGEVAMKTDDVTFSLLEDKLKLIV